MNQAIRSRAVDPDAPIGEPAEILLRFSKPPEKILEKAKSEIEALIDAAEIKKGRPRLFSCPPETLADRMTVPAKAQGRGGRKEPVKPLSGLDIDSLLGESKRTTISLDNAVPEFKQILATAADDATVESAAKQMGEIVRKLIRDSFADLFYARAAENLRVMREELISLEVPALYNKFLTGLKKSILSGELDGDRREMWFKHVIGGRLGLITRDESEESEVTADEAKVVSLLSGVFPQRFTD
jgi:ATP-dependent DNA helicase 2 subunit 2